MENGTLAYINWDVKCPKCMGRLIHLNKHIGIAHFEGCPTLNYLWETFPKLMQRITSERYVPELIKTG